MFTSAVQPPVPGPWRMADPPSWHVEGDGVPSAAPPRPAAALGLHSLGHTITGVTVDGAAAAWRHRPARQPGMPLASQPNGGTAMAACDDGPDSGGMTAAYVAEVAYHDYLALAQDELEPDLVIQLPVSASSTAAAAAALVDANGNQAGGAEPTAGPRPGAEQRALDPALGGTAANATGRDAAPRNAPSKVPAR
jgi:hypothetical protein